MDYFGSEDDEYDENNEYESGLAENDDDEHDSEMAEDGDDDGDGDDDNAESDENDEDHAKHRFKDSLLSHIRATHASGSFAVMDNAPVVLPGMSVKNRKPASVMSTAATLEPEDETYESVPFPLSAENARALIQISSRASFDKRDKTVVDTPIHNPWEIDASRIQFANPEWQTHLRQIVESSINALGVDCDRSHVKAELCKMLIYEKGDMIDPHRDSETPLGLFGNLVICLPSAHRGGAVSLQHNGKTARFDTEPKSEFGVTYMAWYRDVSHEIEPVTDGYKWVLTYNLIKEGGPDKPSAANIADRAGKLHALLQRWHRDRSPKHLAIPLENKYPYDNLSLRSLKGDDFAQTHHVAGICSEDGNFDVFLATLDVELVGEEERWDGEEVETVMSLTHVADVSGVRLAVNNLAFEEEDVVGAEPYDDRTPDEESPGGFGDPYGGGWIRKYRDSVMVIVHKDYLLRFLIGYNGSAADLDTIIRALEQNSVPKGKQIIVDLCRLALRQRSCDRGFTGSVAVAACRLKDVELFNQAVKQTTPSFFEEHWRQLGSSFDPYAHAVLEESMIEALTKSEKLHIIHDSVVAFRGGMQPVNGNEAARREGWLTSILMGAMEKTGTISRDDPRALVEMILQPPGRFRQFIVYQNVRKLLTRVLSSDDQFFPSALLLEISIESPESSFESALLRHLVRIISDHGFPALDMQRCVDYLDRSKASPSFAKNASRHRQSFPRYSALSTAPRTEHPFPSREKFGTTMRALYSMVDPDRRPVLLQQLCSKIPTVMSDKQLDFVLSFLEMVAPVADASTAAVQSCFCWIAILYINHTVGEEPARPRDFARPKDLFPPLDCQCPSKINDFLRNPHLESLVIACDHDSPNMIRYLGSRPLYVDTSRLSTKGKVKTIRIKKTVRRWQELHAKWEMRAEEVLGRLRAISNLRQCLGDECDSILNLRKPQDKSEEARPVPSKVPRKRGRADTDGGSHQ